MELLGERMIARGWRRLLGACALGLLLAAPVPATARHRRRAAHQPPHVKKAPAAKPRLASVMDLSAIAGRLKPARAAQVRPFVQHLRQDVLFQQPSLLSSLRLVEQYHSAIEAAAERYGLSTLLLKGLFVVECAGSPNAVDYVFLEGKSAKSHVGIGQQGTFEAAQAGLRVDPVSEAQVHAAIVAEAALAAKLAACAIPQQRAQLLLQWQKTDQARTAALATWMKNDERFRPKKSILAAAAILAGKLRKYDGDPTLAIAAYHAGDGNIDRVIRLYIQAVLKQAPPPNRLWLSGPEAVLPPARRKALLSARDAGFRAALKRAGISFFDLHAVSSGPVYQRMAGWSDYSRNYFFKVLAAADIVRSYEQDPRQFARDFRRFGRPALDVAQITSRRARRRH